MIPNRNRLHGALLITPASPYCHLSVACIFSAALKVVAAALGTLTASEFNIFAKVCKALACSRYMHPRVLELSGALL